MKNPLQAISNMDMTDSLAEEEGAPAEVVEGPLEAKEGATITIIITTAITMTDMVNIEGHARKFHLIKDPDYPLNLLQAPKGSMATARDQEAQETRKKVLWI